jgi:hypothetical protein
MIKDGATTPGCSRRQKFICILKRKPLSTAAIRPAESARQHGDTEEAQRLFFVSPRAQSAPSRRKRTAESSKPHIFILRDYFHQSAWAMTWWPPNVFRTEWGAKLYADIRSVVETARRRAIGALDALTGNGCRPQPESFKGEELPQIRLHGVNTRVNAITTAAPIAAPPIPAAVMP